MTKYNNYRVKQFANTNGDMDYWVIAGTEEVPDMQLKIAKIPHWIAFPNAVAVAIAAGLNRNSKYQLVDLI